MTQWLLENNLVALNTMYKKSPQKQVTYHTQRGAKKQLDYIMTDRKPLCWSKDAEANETIDMGSDHRCVMAMFEIPKVRRKTRGNKAPPTDCERDTCEDEHELMYRDLEQEVKGAEPKKTKKITAKVATEAEARALTQKAAAAEAAAWAETEALSAAKEEELMTMSNTAAAEGTDASEAQETKGKRQRNSGPHTRKEDDCEARERTNP